MSRYATAEAAALRQRGGGRAGRGKCPCLIDATEFLGEPLRPPARDRGIVVDEDERAIVDRLAVEEGLDQHKGLPVLIARRIRHFVVGTGELPIQKPEEGAPFGLRVSRNPRGQQCLDGILMGPVLDGETIAGVMPRRQCGQRRLTAWGDWDRKSFECHEMSFWPRVRCRTERRIPKTTRLATTKAIARTSEAPKEPMKPWRPVQAAISPKTPAMSTDPAQTVSNATTSSTWCSSRFRSCTTRFLTASRRA